jgi:abortive infection bacteriophage resistance protein
MFPPAGQKQLGCSVPEEYFSSSSFSVVFFLFFFNKKLKKLVLEVSKHDLSSS